MDEIKIEIDLDDNPPDPDQAGNILMNALGQKMHKDQAKARGGKVWLALAALVILWLVYLFFLA